MDIQSPTELARFISSNELNGLDAAFQQLVHCINTYSTWCNCRKTADKEKLYVACKTLYSQCATEIIPKHKAAFLLRTPDRKLVLYSDGRLISIVEQ